SGEISVDVILRLAGRVAGAGDPRPGLGLLAIAGQRVESTGVVVEVLRLLQDGAGAGGAGVGDFLAGAGDDVIVLISPEIRDVVAVIVGGREIAVAGQARHIVVFVEGTLNLGLFYRVAREKIAGGRGAAAKERRRIDVLGDACAHGAEL